MTDSGAKRLCAEILRRAVLDVHQDIYPQHAMRFLKSAWAGEMFELLDIDQRMACREARRHMPQRAKAEQSP